VADGKTMAGGDEASSLTNLWRRFRRRPHWLQVVTWVVAAVVVLVIIGAVAGGISQTGHRQM
jgi:hypothetical protein